MLAQLFFYMINQETKSKTKDNFSTASKGLLAATPVMLAYLSLGTAAGVIGSEHGLSVAEVGLLSLLLYAGAGQFIFAEMHLGPVSSLLSTILLINLRHLLYSSVLAQHCQRLTWPSRLTAGAQLTDETFLVAVTSLGSAQIGSLRWIFALNGGSYLAWFAGNLLGALLVPYFDFSVLGIEFAAVAMYTVLIALQIAGCKSFSIGMVLCLVIVATGLAATTITILFPHPAAPVTIAVLVSAVSVIIFGPAEQDRKLARLLASNIKEGRR